MAAEYKSIEYRLHECLVQVQEFLILLDFDAKLINEICECKDLLKSKKYNVAVMGEFKRGKSSLINALLGSKILPADATPTTATINRITYGTTPKTEILYKDGTTQQININDLEDYVTKLTAEGETRAQKIKEATVSYPTVICQNHVDIIDTPGLNDDENMTQITIDMLNNVDGVIVPLHTKAPFSETERKFVCQMIKNEKINNIIFVVTFIDQLDEDERSYEDYMQYVKNRIQSSVYEEFSKNREDKAYLDKAHYLLDKIQLIGISSSKAIKAFTNNNQALLRESHFEEFKDHLLRAITSKQLENAIKKSIELIEMIVLQLDEQNLKKMKAYNQEAITLEKATKSVEEYCSESKHFVDDLFAENYDYLEKTIKKNNDLRNILVRMFIKKLAGVAVDEHNAIKHVLTLASDESLEYVNSDYKIGIDNEISSLYQHSLDRISDYRKSHVSDAFVALKMDKSSNNFCESMAQFVQKILNNTQFEWTVSPISDSQDLSQVNVIETVITSVDHSVTQLINTYQGGMSAIRKNWFLVVNDDSESLRKQVNEQYNLVANQLDSSVKAHVKNFQVFKGNSRMILTKCENLWKDFSLEESH